MKKTFTGYLTITVEDIIALANVALIRVKDENGVVRGIARNGVQANNLAECFGEREVIEFTCNVKEEKTGYHWLDIWMK